MSIKKRNMQQTSSWRIVRLVLLALVAFVFVLGILAKKDSSVAQVNIEVNPLPDNKFLISEKELGDRLTKHLGYTLENVNIKELDLHHLEQFIMQDGRLASADIYLDKHNRLWVEAVQKNPVVRIKDKRNAYYLDKNGDHIPAKSGVAVRVPVATGEIGPYDKEKVSKPGTVLNDLLVLARYISEDESFRIPLVDQIDIDKNGEITLVPKVGRNTIEFGTIDKMEDKFYKLKVYYNQGVKYTGLDKFATLNVKYQDQVVLKEK